ncbi:contactin-1a, partial [Tachysurus ichikawai]
DGQAGMSSCELLIKNTQLKHAGLYTCMVQTPVDNVTGSADLVCLAAGLQDEVNNEV